MHEYFLDEVHVSRNYVCSLLPVAQLNRNVNDEECLLLTSVSKGCTSLSFFKFRMTFTLTKYLEKSSSHDCLFVGWLLNVPATCECISGTDLLRQFYVLPH